MNFFPIPLSFSITSSLYVAFSIFLLPQTHSFFSCFLSCFSHCFFLRYPLLYLFLNRLSSIVVFPSLSVFLHPSSFHFPFTCLLPFSCFCYFHCVSFYFLICFFLVFIPFSMSYLLSSFSIAFCLPSTFWFPFSLHLFSPPFSSLSLFLFISLLLCSLIYFFLSTVRSYQEVWT
jgi:hypothetical protein